MFHKIQQKNIQAMMNSSSGFKISFLNVER